MSSLFATCPPKTCARAILALVERHDVARLETGYSVEFFDMLGNTVAVVTLPASALRAPTNADRPAVRRTTVTV